MKKYIIVLFVAIALLSCSKKEEQKVAMPKGFELSNTMLKSIVLAKVEKKYIQDNYNPP